MNSLFIALAAIVTALGGGAGLYALFTVKAQRGKIVAEAGSTVATTVSVLLGGAEEMVASERELAEARVSAAETRSDIVSLRRETLVLERRIRRLVDMIHEPGQTVERLREMFPEQNGQ